MSRGSTVKSVVLAAAVLLLLPAALSGITVDPAMEPDSAGDIEYRFEITNDGDEGSTAERLFMLFPTAASPSSTDPFEVAEEDVEAPSGWMVERVFSRGGGAEQDTVVLSDGSLAEGESLTVNITPDRNAVGGYPFDVNLSNGDVYSQNVFIDGKAPRVLSRSPTTDNLTESSVDLVAEYTDGDGVGVDESSVRLRVNDREIDASPEENILETTINDTVTAEGQNNVSLLLVDDYGYSAWRNWTFGLAVDPILDEQSPTGIMQDDSPQIEVRYRDPSPLDASGTTVAIDDQSHGSEDSDFSTTDDDGATWIRYDLPYSLEDGDHDVTVTAADDKGNSQMLSWTFTVDTTPPEIDSISVSDGDTYREDMPVFIDASDATTEVDRVEIEVGDETETVSEEVQDEYRGRIDTTELADGDHTLTVTVYDTAGNSREEEYGVTIDNDPPDITYTDLFPDPTNVAPGLEVTGEDTATQVIAAEYFIGSDPGQGDGEPLSIEERQGLETSFAATVDITDLEDGTYELGVRVKDNVQHWSDVEEIGFRLDRSLQAALAFQDIMPVRLRQGENGQTRIDIKNTGKVPGQVNLSAEAPFQTLVVQNDRLIRPGETRSFHLNVSVPIDAELSNRTLNLTARADTTMTNASTRLIVEANEKTRADIESRLDDITEDLKSLRDRRDRWRRQVDDAVIENVSGRIDELQSAVEEIEQAIEQDDYRTAQAGVSGVPAEIEDAGQQLQEGIQQYQEAKQRRNMILAVLAVLIALGIVAWYRYRPPPEGYDGEEDRFTVREDGDKHPLQVRGEELLHRLRARAEDAIEKMRQRMMDVDVSADQGTDTEEDEGWGGYSPDADER